MTENGFYGIYAPKEASVAMKGAHVTLALREHWRVRRALQHIRRNTALALYQSGVLARWARRPSRRTTPISVMYHSVGGVGLSPDMVVSEANFKSHIQYLRRHYHLMSLQEAVDLIEAQLPIPRNAAVVTLDDGFRDNYQTALPILKQYACPATLFVAVEPLDTGRTLWSQSLWHWLQTTQEKQLRLSWRSKTATDHVEKLLSLQSGAERSQARAWLKTVAGALKVDERQDFLRLVARELRANNGVDASAVDTMLTWSQVREMHRSGVNIGSHTVTPSATERTRAGGGAP